MDLNTFRILALDYPETSEQPHFEKTSFRVKKKIFATYDDKTGLLCFKFSEATQDVYTTLASRFAYKVPNKWGKQGWTFVKLAEAPDALLKDALLQSYKQVAPPQLTAQFKESDLEE